MAGDTPGHVPGHLSLIVRGDRATYLPAGDATYDRLAGSEAFRPSP